MCQFGPVKIPGGPGRGHSWKFNPPPLSLHKIGSGKLVHDKKFLLEKSNALEWSKRSKRMYEKVLLLSVPFRSKHFDAFCIFLSFFFSVIKHIQNVLHIMGTTTFYWITLILCSNWACRIWFGILSSRALSFCIVVSDFVYLLPFSNKFPFKEHTNLHWGLSLIHNIGP